MERLIQNIMKRSDITEQELKEKRQIATPMGETLYWDYYCYVREHPINKWNVPTAILCGSDDNITEQEIFKSFSQRFNCDLTVMKGGKHWFHTKQQTAVICKWLDEHI
jgi:pimeloyl-ACP methyl ester carboxylesterase